MAVTDVRIKTAGGWVSIKGPAGSDGAPGVDGDDGTSLGYRYAYSNSTTEADPTAGVFALDNTTLASVSELYISGTDAFSNNLDGVLATWDDSTSTVKGTLYIVKEAAPDDFIELQVTGTRDTHSGAGWSTFTVSHVAHAGTFTATDVCRIFFIRTGDQGSPGAGGGDPGPPGADGEDGKTVLNGSGAPGGGTGVDGDFYINTSAWTIYGPKTAGSWGSPTSLIGPAGSDGADGTDGSPGAPGADGRTLLNGSGVPGSGLGANGDFYINTAAWTIYGPKTAGAWGSGTSLIGPAGSNGSNGTNGTNGLTILNGSGAPSGGTGVNGDFYINTTAWTIYGPKSGGAWGSATSLIGPAGADGADGTDATLPSGYLIAVNVTTDGGDGDTTPFTYSVSLLSGGSPILTGASPEWVYEPNVKVTAATHGTARWTGSAYVLYQVDEVPDDTTCA